MDLSIQRLYSCFQAIFIVCCENRMLFLAYLCVDTSTTDEISSLILILILSASSGVPAGLMHMSLREISFPQHFIRSQDTLNDIKLYSYLSVCCRNPCTIYCRVGLHLPIEFLGWIFLCQRFSFHASVRRPVVPLPSRLHCLCITERTMLFTTQMISSATTKWWVG